MNKKKMYHFGAAVARCCPIQLGHERVFQEMIDLCEHCFVFLGSANAPWSLPLFFNYHERRELIRLVFPKLHVVPLPDFPNDNPSWLDAIDDILLVAGMNPAETTFFGGSDEDVLVLSEDGHRRTHIVNRFDGSTPVISASQVRDALIHKRALDGMLNPCIMDEVLRIWTEKWPKFLKKR